MQIYLFAPPGRTTPSLADLLILFPLTADLFPPLADPSLSLLADHSDPSLSVDPSHLFAFWGEFICFMNLP